MRTRTRERLGDAGVVLGAAGVTFVLARASSDDLFLAYFITGVTPLRASELSPWPSGLPPADQFLGLLACGVLWWRRRRPVPVAVGLLALSLFATAAVPTMVALYTVAVRCAPRTTAWVAGLAVLPSVVFVTWMSGWGSLWLSVRPLPLMVMPIVGCLLISGTVGWGLYLRSKRLLVDSLRERASRAEAEAALRAERAQRRAREQVAREMHDVLGHRLSLLSVHAGALEYFPRASPEQIERAAGVIRESAHQALQDLRTVLDVLRDPATAESDAARPLPTLRDLRTLVAECRAAGMEVEVSRRPTELVGVPRASGLAAYRVVQEALTNARKHAPGEPVRVELEGAPEEGLTVEIRNPLPDAASNPAGERPGTGQGLIGLVERAALAGGRLTYEGTGGEFVVRAWLPWPA
ncbi:histidine kinase [Streptomyces sp. B6B3]|uniref:sensor histidine kinase n=1 Tax=Streptomyces sp. B6B3 TaxID=3153570 RepID=UPI00325C54C3